MSKLVPEKRVDKNGVVVTRHVRLNNVPTGTKPLLPSPKLSKGRQEAVTELLDMIGVNTPMTNKTVEERNRIKKVAQSLPDEDVALAKGLITGAKSQQGTSTRSVMVRQVLESGSGCSFKLRTAEAMLNGSRIAPNLIMSFLYEINGKGEFDERVFNLTEEDPEVQQKVFQLADATMKMTQVSELYKTALGGNDLRHIMVSNGKGFDCTQPEVFDAMVNHPERSMEILEWYKKRRDASSISDLLNVAPALGDGTL